MDVIKELFEVFVKIKKWGVGGLGRGWLGVRVDVTEKRSFCEN